MLLGEIIRPHGLKGLLRVQSYADSVGSFLNAGAVFLRSEEGLWYEYAVLSVNRKKSTILMALDGIDSRNKAEKYQGAEIFIRRESIPLDEDEYLWDEIIGLKVYSETGESLGDIVSIVATGAKDIYVI